MSFTGGGEEIKKLLGNTFQSHTQNLVVWGGFLSFSLLVYYFLSSGDFSFLLTYASFMRCFGFSLLNFKMWSEKTAKGISVKTMEIYALVFFFRLLSIMRHQGYLPFDKTGDWFYHVVETLSFCAVGLALFGMFGPLKPSYEPKLDVFGNLHIANEFGIAYIVIPCIVMAVFLHPALNREFFSDTCWTISMYLEAMAMMPQIYMFQKQAEEKKGSVETLIGHTVFALGFSRIFELIFWLSSFKELSSHSGSRLPGYVVLLSQFVHLVIMGDFFYFYFRSLQKGAPMELPTTYSGSGSLV